MRLIALLLGLGLATAGCDRQKAPDPQGEGGGGGGAPKQTAAATAPAAKGVPEGLGRLDRSHAGKPAPTAAFEDADGELTGLVQFRGKPVLVNLWATWCGPCVAEMPTLNALAGAAKDYEVIVVSQDMAGRDKVDAFFAKHRLANLEPFLDSELSMMRELSIDTLPTTILFDKDGREVWRVTGIEDWQGKRAAGLIAEATGTAAPKPAA